MDDKVFVMRVKRKRTGLIDMASPTLDLYDSECDLVFSEVQELNCATIMRVSHTCPNQVPPINQ